MKIPVNIQDSIIIVLLIISGLHLKAQIHAKHIRYDSIISNYVSQVNADSIENYIQFMEDMGTRFLIAPNHREVAESIREKFLSLGVAEVRIDSFYCTTVIDYANLEFDTVTTQYNVIATIPGVIDYDEFCVIGAHYDNVVAPSGDPMTLAPGADDNASGVSALFEVARIFSLNEYQPVRTIELVAFAAEELMYFGHSGAQAYVDSSLAHGIDLEMMINNDMIAYTGTDDWEITISNYKNCEWFTQMAKQVCEDHTELEPVILNSSSQGGADCKYFYEAGVPCVYFMEKDFNPFYHTINDLTSNADMDYCTEAVKISVGLLLQLDGWVVSNQVAEWSSHINVFPNPFTTSTTIEYTLNSPQTVNITFYTQCGKQVDWIEEKQSAGKQRVLWSPDLPGGVYFVSLRTGSRISGRQLVMLR